MGFLFRVLQFVSSPISCTKPWMWFPNSNKICHEYTASATEISFFISRKTSVLFSMTQRNSLASDTSWRFAVYKPQEFCVVSIILFVSRSKRQVSCQFHKDTYMMLMSLSSRVWHHVDWYSPSTRRNMLVLCFTYTLKTEAPHPLETSRTTHQNTQSRSSEEYI